ncbi:hypothetical protein Rhopal_005566-T1 [Rhodotorula paludigena]|uniref:Piwi domain-containing protein n=1 Tax=Rhodotorula paludigena TaxID=86838 RepID=A0AAV5GIR5_9BASI|nr:hypothetical protein Rhopal_005566-T1 [Rhodotorula paludigena]
MPRNGVWDVRGQQLYNATTIERWLVVVFDSSQYFTLNDTQSAIMGLVHECENMGIRVYDKQPDIHYAPRGADTHAFIKELGMKMFEREGKPPQLVIAFLSRKPCDQYADFENKVKRANPQYWQNVVLKINVKMQGGINSILKPADLGPVGERPTVLGADVSHASPGSLAPSVAALVGSLDATCSIYGSAITIQPSRLEVVACMNEMVIKLLKQFEDKHGLLPERLIMLRDGISEGQFPQVIATEVAAIRLACEHFGPDYKPALTFITCGKRHKISLFPKERVNADAKTGNVRSGTTVDTEIVSPFTFDWYTQSHASLLGTGRSSHYTVLLDDSGFSADQLQQLVFNLCFTYARATRAVSVATPAFYASRLCTRAQLLLKREDDDTTTVLSSTSGSSEERLRQNALAEYRSRLKARISTCDWPKVHVNHAESLFYM